VASFESGRRYGPDPGCLAIRLNKRAIFIETCMKNIGLLHPVFLLVVPAAQVYEIIGNCRAASAPFALKRSISPDYFFTGNMTEAS
jgi:hypothetical protein